MIILENFGVSFNENKIIDGLDFTFEPLKFYGITGASGIGKTTLLNCIAGLNKNYSGKIVNSFPCASYIFQDARLFPWLTALENVECVCQDKDRARAMLELFLPDSAHKLPHELSGGMKQRVSIARALAYDAPLLLLDEPFKGLDAQTKQHTVEMVVEYIKGRTAILISHDKNELLLCDTILKMEGTPVHLLSGINSTDIW